MSLEFCTVEEVRQLLQKKSTDHTQDPMIETLIKRASRRIQNYCERQFAPVEVDVTKVFEWERQAEIVNFAPYDLQSVTNAETSVVADSDLAEPYVCSKEEYRLWPYETRDGTYLGIRMRPFGASFGSIVWKNRQASITGTWGMPEIPEDVIQATVFSVVHWITGNVAAFRDPAEDANVQMPVKRGIPLEAKEMVDRFKRAVS